MPHASYTIKSFTTISWNAESIAPAPAAGSSRTLNKPRTMDKG